MRRLLLLTALLLLASLAPAAASDGAVRHIIRGRGFGHGVGMSQYGAYGYAKHGRSYRRILAHYYQHTQLQKRAATRVRVLLQSGRASARFRGATRMGVGRRLNARRVYTVRRSSGGRVALLRSDGSLVGRFRSGMSVVAGRKGIRLFGGAINGVTSGRYRGGFQFRDSRVGGINAINRLKLDPYVRGVVAAEMPSSWSYEALKAQAVAARSFGLAQSLSGATFDLYPDQRSQVYNGVRSETARTDRAVRKTAGQVVTYRGRVATTYFFSTSGGRTENVENVFYGPSKPYLVSVEDKYESFAPKHRWRFSFSSRELDDRLGAPGGFVRLEVLKRGVSPRIVTARIVGTQGSKRIKGYPLRFALGVYDSWIRYTRVSTAQATRVRSAGWIGERRYRSRELAGSFWPAPRARQLTVERRVGSSWRRLKTVRTSRGGRYRTSVPAPGVYRIRAGGDVGPAARVR